MTEFEAADRELFVGLYPELRRFAAVVGPYEVEPDDLVQEAVLQALRRRRLFEYDDAGAYLRRVIVNLAANHRRRLGRGRRALRLAAPAPSAGPTSYPSDVTDLLRLPAAVRGALFLVDVEGWSFREVAEALGCSEPAARQRVSRGRRQLRALLAAEG